MSIQEVLDRLVEINKSLDEYEVVRETHKLVRENITPYKDTAFKTAFIMSKEFTNIIKRTGWIIESEEELDKAIGKLPCPKCEPNWTCGLCKEKQIRIENFNKMKGKK